MTQNPKSSGKPKTAGRPKKKVEDPGEYEQIHIFIQNCYLIKYIFSIVIGIEKLSKKKMKNFQPKLMQKLKQLFDLNLHLITLKMVK